jgi:hypothetical protein
VSGTSAASVNARETDPFELAVSGSRGNKVIGFGNQISRVTLK